jgi:microcystin-dependent protein
VNGTSDAGSSHNHTISGSTASTGSTTAFNVLQPYMPINYIIRLL